MARIRPFAGWRYAVGESDITRLVAPPYDVVSPEMRQSLLAGDPQNIVALELPDGSPSPDAEDSRYRMAKHLWDDWRAENVLSQDAPPAVYVLEQSYRREDRDIRRKALIVEVGLEPLDGGVVLPHERTLPKALGDRFELIKATGANFSQVFGLYDDVERETDAVFASVMATDPISCATDADGVTSTLWASNDEALGARLAEFMAPRQIFIADGHHRYTTALAYRDLRRASSPNDPADAPYEYVMMALVSMQDPDLVVLPTHRVADSPAFDRDNFLESLSRHFAVEPIDQGTAHGALDGSDRPAMLMRLRGDDALYRISLRDGIEPETAIEGDHSLAWKSLDVTILQELILGPLFGIDSSRPETLERLGFIKDSHAAMKANAEHDAVFILRSTRVDQLRAVALAGETMPQKSTYFFPKLLSGLVMRAAD